MPKNSILNLLSYAPIAAIAVGALLFLRDTIIFKRHSLS
jgi:hypothetical protein